MANYGTIEGLAANAAALAIKPFDDAARTNALEAASSEADSYLGSRYTVPLATPGPMVEQVVYDIAIWRLLGPRNYDPQNPASTFRVRYTDAIQWLKDVRDYKLDPAGLVEGEEADPAPARATPRIVTNTKRGW